MSLLPFRRLPPIRVHRLPGKIADHSGVTDLARKRTPVRRAVILTEKAKCTPQLARKVQNQRFFAIGPFPDSTLAELKERFNVHYFSKLPALDDIQFSVATRIQAVATVTICWTPTNSAGQASECGNSYACLVWERTLSIWSPRENAQSLSPIRPILLRRR